VAPLTNALFVDGYLEDREYIKDRRKSTPIAGFDIFNTGFIKAALRYSPRDAIYFMSPVSAQPLG
jgi:hypothetical protein